jgi:hypothetical protein
VRQLNFYSFRKVRHVDCSYVNFLYRTRLVSHIFDPFPQVNRERNVWIYKHKLFHRDRPEDLHLVRRRTCPGVDGRKHRFSRLSARKLSRQVGVKKSASSDEDESSIEEEVVVEAIEDPFQPEKTDDVTGADVISLLKRSRRVWGGDSEKPSIVNISEVTSPSFASPADRCKQEQISEDDDASAAVGKSAVANKRLEMAQQSMVVSEVAMKLEEYAKKAMKVSGMSRTRRGGLGIVTPPFGASHSLSTRGLITYDDEYETSSESHASSAGVVSVGDESSVNEDESPHPRASTVMALEEPVAEYFSSSRELFGQPPVHDINVVKKITERILEGGEAWVASAAVAGFCTATPPTDDGVLASKILHLISSCPNLASEFQQYRAALHPQECLGESCNPFATTPGLMTATTNQAVSIHHIWERAACRGGAVRDFKTFAVNTIHKVMLRVTFQEDDAAALERTADVWLKSVGGKHEDHHRRCA